MFRTFAVGATYDGAWDVEELKNIRVWLLGSCDIIITPEKYLFFSQRYFDLPREARSCVLGEVVEARRAS